MFPWLGVVMEHRTLVQRSSQSSENFVADRATWQCGKGNQPQCCGGLWDSTLGCAARGRSRDARRVAREGVQQSESRFQCKREVFRAVSVGRTFLAQPEARGHTCHSAASRGLDVLCERIRQVANSVSEQRGATKHRAHDCLPSEPV